MKKLSILFAMIVISSCSNQKSSPTLDDYRETYGLLYYQLPSSGRQITCVFLPYKNQDQQSDNLNIEAGNFDPGIQFETAYTYLFIKSDALNKNVGLMNSDTSKKVFLIPGVKIFFHVNKPLYTEGNSINTKELRHDNLKYNSKVVETNFFFSTIAVDSIRIPNLKIN